MNDNYRMLNNSIKTNLLLYDIIDKRG